MLPPLLPDSHPMLRQVMPMFDFKHGDAPAYAKALASTLTEAMIHYEGIGLAANQVGIRERVCAVQIGGEIIVMFNPLVTWLSVESVALTEGCLSFTGLKLSIKRPKECQVAYDDVDGIRKVIDLKGLEARCALHELDHLDGKTFTSRVSKLKLDMAKKKLAKYPK